MKLSFAKIGLIALLVGAGTACSEEREPSAPSDACIDCSDAEPEPALDAATSPLDGAAPGSMDAAMDAAVHGDAGDDGDASDARRDATTPVVDCEPGALLCLGRELAQCDDDAGDAIDIVERCSDRGLRCVEDECAALPPGERLWERTIATDGYDSPGVVAVDPSGMVLASMWLNDTTPRGVLRSYDANGRLLVEDELDDDTLGFRGVDSDGDQIFVQANDTVSVAFQAVTMTRRDASGGLRWTRTVGGDDWSSANIEDVAIARDGTVYVCLVIALRTLRVLKIDREAELVHEEILGEASARAYCAADFASRGSATTWRDETTPDADAWVHKLDANGQLDWDWTLDLGGDELTMDLAGDRDGNTYVAGVIYEQHGWLRKLDPSGEELWSRMLQANTVPSAIGVDPESNDVVIAFGEDDEAGGSVVHIRKYDPNGTELWTKTEGGGGVSVWPADLAIAPDGDVLVLGNKGSIDDYDIWLARFAP